MGKNGYCQVCKGFCHYSCHMSSFEIIEEEEVKEEENDEFEKIIALHLDTIDKKTFVIGIRSDV